ncbi:MAG TPA: amidohydrolase family protein [Candidatus Acidoferrales bacterium]|nr:amidohydrolase family protein [Candidatus Acidoferrales bacterium]
MNRRQVMMLPGAGFFFRLRSAHGAPQTSPAPGATPTDTARDMPLERYEPKSMLHASETHVPRSRFPVIDFHTHITFAAGGANIGAIRFSMDPANCLAVMDRKNVRTMVNVTGGYGEGLREAIGKLPTAHPGRFIVFTEPVWNKASDAGYSKFQADQIEDAHKAGAKGLKVLKTLGLFLRERGSGKLVRIDDPRFDPMWEAVGSLKMPVAIHTSDPEAFFLPIDRFNERWEELHAHPDWSFHGKDFPGNRELQEARRNVMRRHPRTQFVCLHVANSEDLTYVSECLDSHPNMFVDIAARIGELGRQPRLARKFFDKYQDRIVFGTDASAGTSTPQQTFGDALYEIYYRTLETEDEYFDYAPAAIPPQGRWRIYGLGLSDQVLRKVYGENASRLIGLSA